MGLALNGVTRWADTGGSSATRTAHLVKGWAAAGKDGLFMDHSSMVGPWSSFLRLVMSIQTMSIFWHTDLPGISFRVNPKQMSYTMHRPAVKMSFCTGTLTSGPEASSAPCLTHQEFCDCPQWGGSFCATSLREQWSEGSEQRCIRISAQSSQQLCMRIGITLAGGLVAFLSSLSHAGRFCPCCYYCIL